MRPIATFVALLALLGLSACSASKSSHPSTGGSSHAASFVAAVKTHTIATGSDLAQTITEGNALITGDLAGDVNQTAKDAQTVHDNLSQFRDEIATAPNSTDSNELNMAIAVNDLKNAAGALVAYAGTPNAATLAHYSSQMATAISEWNAAVTPLWAAAQAGAAPVISTVVSS